MKIAICQQFCVLRMQLRIHENSHMSDTFLQLIFRGFTFDIWLFKCLRQFSGAPFRWWRPSLTSDNVSKNKSLQHRVKTSKTSSRTESILNSAGKKKSKEKIFMLLVAPSGPPQTELRIISIMLYTLCYLNIGVLCCYVRVTSWSALIYPRNNRL